MSTSPSPAPDQNAHGAALASIRRAPPGGRISRQFLLFSMVVIAAAMLGLGAGVSVIVGQGITTGVGDTASASLEAFIGHTISHDDDPALSDDERASLEEHMKIVSESETTRLLDVRLWALDGTTLYAGQQPLQDRLDPAAFEAAKAGEQRSEVVAVTLAGAGPVESLPLTLLRIYAPIRTGSDGSIMAIATFYFSTRALATQQEAARWLVWSLVLSTGIAVQVILFVFVARIDRRLAAQDERLLTTLDETAALATQNDGLRREAEQLRLDAINANESLLARVGADIHDGPLQLMTLIHMRLGRLKDSAAAAPLIGLAADTISELRNLSVGLVLPELEHLTLAETVRLAASRHESITGTSVTVALAGLDINVSAALRTSVFRIVQQSLANAVQHAGGHGQRIESRVSADGLVLDISSDGTAPAKPAKDGRPRLGLRGMNLRAEAIGGTLDMFWDEGRNVVRLTVPNAVLA